MKAVIKLAIFSFHTCPLASSEGKQTGGLNVHVLETAKELGKIGFQVDMFTRSQNAKEPHVVQVSPNVRLIHLIAGPEKPVSKKLLLPFVSSFAKEFIKFSKKNNVKYDLLHCHYYLSGIVGLIVNKKLRRPLIISFHTLALMKNLVGRSEDEKEEKIRLDTEFELVKKADFIIASSENDAAYLKYLYNSPAGKIRVVSPGVDTNLFFPISKKTARKSVNALPGKKIILAVGRIEPLKGFDALLYALKILLVKRPELCGKISLWIVGGDTSEPVSLWTGELKHLEYLMRSLGIEAVVKFIGQKTQKELRNYYSAAEVVVMPSHYESFGMVALEAMACGTSVIISDASGVSELVSSNNAGLITTVNNPLLLAEQIEGIIPTGKRLSNFVRNANKNVIKFTWAKSAQRLRRVYLKALGILSRRLVSH